MPTYFDAGRPVCRSVSEMLMLYAIRPYTNIASTTIDGETSSRPGPQARIPRFTDIAPSRVCRDPRNCPPRQLRGYDSGYLWLSAAVASACCSFATSLLLPNSPTAEVMSVSQPIETAAPWASDGTTVSLLKSFIACCWYAS